MTKLWKIAVGTIVVVTALPALTYVAVGLLVYGTLSTCEMLRKDMRSQWLIEDPSDADDYLYGLTPVECAMTVAATRFGRPLREIGIPRIPSERERVLQAAARSDLRNLATVQWAHHERTGLYSGSFPSTRFKPSVFITVDIDTADARGWRATARAVGYQFTCTVFEGPRDEYSEDGLGTESMPLCRN